MILGLWVWSESAPESINTCPVGRQTLPRLTLFLPCVSSLPISAQARKTLISKEFRVFKGYLTVSAQFGGTHAS
jgi:hypothetical protein